MKIPQILAQTDAPASTGAVHSVGYEGAAMRAAAVGLNQVGEAASDLATLERRKQERAARMETSALGSQADMESAAFLENLKITTGDPDEYKRMAAEGLKGISDRTLQATKNEQTKALLAAELQKIGGKRSVEALKYSNDLFVGQQVGRMETSLANRKVTMSLLEPGDDKAWVDEYKKGVADIDNAVPWLGPKAAAQQRLKWRGEVAYERGYRDIQGDPDSNIERYRGLMDPKDYDRLEAKKESLIKSRNAEDEKFYARVEKDAEEERQGLLTKAREDAYAGNLTVDGLNDLRRMRVVTKGDEYATLYRVITTEAKDKPSDPVVLQRIQIATRQQVPRMSNAELDSWLGKGLSRKDWQVEKDHLNARLTAIANSEQAQAEQYMRAVVGKGPNDSYDDQDGQLFAMMLREHSARSNAFPQFGGKEAPLPLAYEIGARVAPIRQERLRLKVDQIRQMMLPSVKAQTSAEATTRLNALRGQLPPSVILAEEAKIMDMFRAEQAATDLQNTLKGGGPGSTSKSGGRKRSTGAAEDTGG